ncbi:MAG: phage holin family protein [Pseudolabrys sp.]|nr:phage holin family protein [Pseudolabrys sp.]
MIDNIVRDLQVLGKADSLIGRIWLNVMARRFGLFALAGLVGVFGLGMANVAGFYGLQQSWGPVWAAAIVAVADLIIALIIVFLGRSIRPGPEIELAFDVRKMALDAIQADARDIKGTVDLFGEQIRQTKDTISGFVHRPLDTAAEHLLVPAVLSIVRGLRSKKEKA